MRIVKISHATYLFIFTLLSTTAAAQTTPAWRDQVEQILCEQWHSISTHASRCAVSFPGLSQQYQLPACHSSWQLSLTKPLQAGRNGLEIVCQTPFWRQNLAVALHSYRPVAVLAQAVLSDQSLTLDDVNFIEHDIGSLSKGFIASEQELIGQITRRALRAGTVLSHDMLNAPLLVSRGDLINIRIQRPGLQIEMKGIALEQGRAGDRIRVRNERSQKIINARVIDQATVLVE